ncbi:MAG: hypothetical protein FJ317_07705, partial [SAR202 cluster bacterium]|nr:hypothetical protein [SAR202 cluster bacterium]
VVVVIVLVAGIGGEHGPGRHSPSGGASNLPVTERVASDVGGPASANEAARVVEVDAFEVAFRPSRVSVAAGETVTFVVTNTGRTVHEFTIGDAAMQQEHAEMTTHMSGAMPHDLPNSISLQPGEAKRITWRFGNAGTLEFACHVPGHYEAGMRGQITVN